MKMISLKLPAGLHAKLERASKQHGQSKSEVVRTALEEFFNGQTTVDKPLSALDLTTNLVGCLKGPGDLSTNPKYMEGYGR